MTKVLGIDGWKKKWIAVSLEDGAFNDFHIFENLDEVALLGPKIPAIAIDVPISLPEKPPRPADKEAAKFIGPRRSSVFASPPVFCLDEKWTDYGETNAECRSRFDSGISAQGFALMKNIRDAAKAAAQNPRIFEVHPEVCFCEMNQGTPLQFTKKSWNGQRERIDLLEKSGIVLPKVLPPEIGKIPVDDILDAAAAAWSAQRIAEGNARSFPENNADENGGKIWF